MRCTISSADMRRLEKSWMDAHGVPSALLMEHAAQGVVSALHEMKPGGKVVFLCGTGNNGGDGYAAARLWQAMGGRSIVLSVGDPETADAGMNRFFCESAGISVHPHHGTDAMPDGDMLVDALLGIGLDRPVEGRLADAIRQVNASGMPVLAVDVPSGLSADTGEVMGHAVRAHRTVTFHRMKTGMVLGAGAEMCGHITVHPILIPAAEGEYGGLYHAALDDLRLIPPRPVYGHKGTFGKALLVVGSLGMAGAAAAAANACIRTGAGLTFVACWENVVPIVQTLAPGAICIPLRTEGASLCGASRDALSKAVAGADCCAVGCGMGFHPAGEEVLALVERASCPVVWDADALTWISRGTASPRPQDVITPHPGEASRLLHTDLSDITDNPLHALDALHQRYGCVALLKGHRTLMTDGGRRAVNMFGTPAMAKGGSGDVLTGIIAGLLCLRASGWQADTLTILQLAAMIHGRAGECAAAVSGENSVTAEQLVSAIDLRPVG